MRRYASLEIQMLPKRYPAFHPGGVMLDLSKTAPLINILPPHLLLCDGSSLWDALAAHRAMRVSVDSSLCSKHCAMYRLAQRRHLPHQAGSENPTYLCRFPSDVTADGNTHQRHLQMAPTPKRCTEIMILPCCVHDIRSIRFGTVIGFAAAFRWMMKFHDICSFP